jgi:S-adenosylmethionine-dependent methyltransferase
MDIKRVEDFYDVGVQYEWDRLDRHIVEFEITTRHLKPFLKDSLKIADIGGGPGKYSFHYANLGHSVTLLDLSNGNIEFAKKKAEDEGIKMDGFFSSSATDMPMLKDDTYDLVLCFGPMYHLQDKGEHLQVISECRRILKRNGILAMAFLTPWSHAFSAIENAPQRMLELKEYYFSLVENQRNISNKDIPFPNGWNPKPENIKGYMESHFFKTETVTGIEGPFGRHFENNLENASQELKEAWLDYIFRLSSEPSLLGSCEHMLYIGRKQ